METKIEQNALAKLSTATRMLAEAGDLKEIQHIRGIALAAAEYAKAAKIGLDAQNTAAEIKIRAERKAGSLLAELKRDKGSPGNQYTVDLSNVGQVHSEYTQALEESDTTRQDANRWQKIATIPEPDFEEFIETTKEAKKELTTAGALKKNKEIKRKNKIKELRLEIEKIDHPSGLYDVVAIDPPWAYKKRPTDITHRAANPYPSMSIDEICNIELPLKDNAIVWLWTTNAFMREAYQVADYWEVEVKTILTWVKNKMGLGDWLRGQTEHCLMCIKGKPIVNLTNQTTVIYGPSREHSRKPDEFYQLVDTLCFGEKIEFFARQKRENWEVYGNEPNKF